MLFKGYGWKQVAYLYMGDKGILWEIQVYCKHVLRDIGKFRKCKEILMDQGID